MNATLGRPVRFTDAIRDDESRLRDCRNAALEDAARAVEAARMPDSGDGPVLLVAVKAEMAKAIRRLAR